VTALSLVVLLTVIGCAKPAERHGLPRAVTLAPSLTELAFATGCGDRVVGTDDHSDFPPAARNLPKVGGVEVDLERLLALRPTVVIASTIADESRLERALNRASVLLVLVKTDRLAQVGAAQRRISEVLGCSEMSGKASSLEERLQTEKRRRSPSPRVLFLAWDNPLYVAGRETFANDLLELSGATNAVDAAVTGWPQYSREALLAARPDVVIFPVESLSGEEVRARFAADPVWREVPAVREGRVYVVDEDLFTRTGPRVPSAARELNSILDRAGFR
jgi:ABC-type hemin transport system substrate-binding protein